MTTTNPGEPVIPGSDLIPGPVTVSDLIPDPTPYPIDPPPRRLDRDGKPIDLPIHDPATEPADHRPALSPTPTPTPTPTPSPSPTSNRCRMMLQINGRWFAVRKLARKGGILGGWRLKDDAGDSVQVVKDKWGRVSCSCGPMRGKDEADCEHARALVACWLIAGSYRAKGKTERGWEAVV